MAAFNPVYQPDETNEVDDGAKDTGFHYHLKNNSQVQALEKNLSVSDLVSVHSNSSDPYRINTSQDAHSEYKQEKWYISLLQMVVPFFIAGFGMVAAGVLLDIVQKWELFIQVPEVIVLVPSLLGLKGNLEMTLASRLSTQVNLGHVSGKDTIIRAVLGNFAIVQLQSIVVGFLASFVACITSFLLSQKFSGINLMIMIASSVCTASIASLFLGGIIMGIIILSKRFKINPDNIATPIASSMGDFVTLGILGGVGTFFYLYRNMYWIHIIIIVFYLVCIPLLGYYSYRNEFVRETLFQGWAPIIIAMLISSAAGILLDVAIESYSSLAIYQPVVNGVGGNLVAIFASRLSTCLYTFNEPGKWADWAPKKYILYPIEAFFAKKNYEHKTAIILMSLALPGHIVFFFTIYFIKPADERPDLTASLVLFYLLVALLQVLILLIFCYFLVHVVWRLKRNPDIFCIPLLTASGDLLGVSLLFLAFYLVYITGNVSVATNKAETNVVVNGTNASVFAASINRTVLYFSVS